MTKNQKHYHFLRFITICMTTIMLPLGTFVGYQFGAGNTAFAVKALAVQCALTAIQAYVWWLTLELSGKK